MKLLPAAVLVLVALQAQAQDVATEHERIKSERAAAELRFAAGQRECRGKFAVNDCMAKVKREHNVVIGDLKRQENVLNDAERRRRSAERQQAVDERNSPEAREKAEQRRQQALHDQEGREQRAGEKAGKRATEDAERAQKGPRAAKEPKGTAPPQGAAHAAHPNKPSGPSPEEAAKNKREHEQRLKEAEQHRMEVAQRIAKRSKPAASALPVPAH